jgi:hypothetical protein
MIIGRSQPSVDVEQTTVRTTSATRYFVGQLGTLGVSGD